MARIAGIDLPKDKRIEIGLTYIYGIGRKSAKDILAQTGVNPDTRVKDLSDADEQKLRDAIDSYFENQYGKYNFIDTAGMRRKSRIDEGTEYFSMVRALRSVDGADVAILYLDQHQDAEQTRKDVEQHGRRCLTFAGDVADRDVCRKVVDETLAQLLVEYPVAQAWFSFTLRDSQHLSDGTPLRDVLAFLADYPQILAVGINCIALENTVDALSYLHSQTSLPLVVYPNSGEHYDAVTKTWHHHGEACATLEGYLPQWLAAGAKLIGGCCRTSPKDIAALKAHC